MPAGFGMIAALQGDLDTSDGVGKVFFRQDSSPALLQQAADHINRAFPEDDVVNPIHAVVVTWVDVASHRTESRGDGPEPSGRVRFSLLVGRSHIQLFLACIFHWCIVGLFYGWLLCFISNANLWKNQASAFVYVLDLKKCITISNACIQLSCNAKSIFLKIFFWVIF